jgi:acid stress-induced BolA-like protein IbaG/YrbA
MDPKEIESLIQRALPQAQVICEDLTGTRDHWKVTVISDLFEGERLLAQHRMVKDALHEKMVDNSIHALTLKTWTTSRWAAR